MAITPKPRRKRVDGEPDRRGAAPGGRQQPHVPTEATRAIVKALIGAGMPQDAVGASLDPPVSPDTLQKHYRFELDNGAALANAKVAGVMFAMATDKAHKDAQRAGQFWLQNRAGWATQAQLNLGVRATGEEAGPSDANVRPAKITVEFVEPPTKPVAPDAGG